MSQAYSEATDREVELVERAKGFFEVHDGDGFKRGRIHGITDASAANHLIRDFEWSLIDYNGEEGLSLWKMWLE